ncbi:MAG: hypothetical protein ACI4SS_02130, partial [Clostridia bacterium]
MKKLLASLMLFAALFVCYGSVSAAEFKHPGTLHTQEDFDRVKAALNAGQEPYLSGWNKLDESSFSKAGWTPRAVETVIRGGNGDNVALLYNDIAHAYQCALKWKLKGDKECGETAKDILNAWSSTLKSIGGNADRYLAAGIFGYQMANCAEIMRDYPGFDVDAMKDMLLN